MLSLHSISGAAISALPTSHHNNGEAELRCQVRYDAVPLSAYRVFVADETTPKVYAVEIPMRPLTDLVD